MERRDFTAEFTVRRKKMRPWAFGLIFCFIALAVALVLALAMGAGQKAFLIIMALFIIPLLAVVIRMTGLTRCPACGKYLGRDVGVFCTHCGVRIQEGGGLE